MNKPQAHTQQPTVFHITHWKAGSQWINKILRELTPEYIVSPRVDQAQFFVAPLAPRSVYPTVYVTREQFYSVRLPKEYRKFVVIRDLRDTLVSGYFSIRYSHPILADQIAIWREKLNSMTIGAGLLMLLDNWLPLSASIQESWIASGERLIRYESLLKRDSKILEDLLIKDCELPISSERLREGIVRNRFENMTEGRKPGEENHFVHERKGISGDWRNHFTPRVIDMFRERYEELLDSAGYAQARS